MCVEFYGGMSRMICVVDSNLDIVFPVDSPRNLGQGLPAYAMKLKRQDQGI